MLEALEVIASRQEPHYASPVQVGNEAKKYWAYFDQVLSAQKLDLVARLAHFHCLLAELSEEERRLVDLRYRDGLSVRAAAREMHMSRSALMRMEQRMLSRLAARLEGGEEEIEAG